MLIELTCEAPSKQRAVLSVDFFTDEHIGGDYASAISISGNGQFSQPREELINLAAKFVAKDNVVNYLKSVFPMARVRELCD